MYTKCDNSNASSEFVGMKVQNGAYKNFMLLKNASFIKTYIDREKEGQGMKFVRSGRMANEMLIPHLFWQSGIDAVEYFPWESEKPIGILPAKDGLLSENALEHKEQFLRLSGLDSILEIIEYLKSLYNVDKDSLKEIEKNLFIMTIVDFLTLQSDRHGSNMPLAIRHDHVRFAKVFDNEYAFCCEHFNDPLFVEKCGIKTGNINVDCIISRFNADKSSGICTNFAPEVFPTSLDGTYDDIAESIATYATEHTYLLSTLHKAMMRTNVFKAAKDLAEKGIEISPWYIAYCNAIVDNGKLQILRELQNLNQIEK